MCYAAIFWSRIGEIVYATDQTDDARAGFDDKVLWNDVGLPPDARRLLMRHTPEAEALFDAWLTMQDKTPY